MTLGHGDSTINIVMAISIIIIIKKRKYYTIYDKPSVNVVSVHSFQFMYTHYVVNTWLIFLDE